MLQHLKEHIEGLDSTPTKLDISSLELYFYDPKMTIYKVYVRYRAERRKSLPHFKELLRGLDKYTPPNRVAYACVRAAGPNGYTTHEAIFEAMRKVYSEVTNERTGRLEIDAPSGAFKDICRRIHRIGNKLGKDMVIHREALPPEHGQALLPEYVELAQSASKVIQDGIKEIRTTVRLSKAQALAGESMVVRLMQHSPDSVKLSERSLKKGVDAAAESLRNRGPSP